MKLEQLAAQLFTVRHHIKEPESIASSMKKISKIGYKSVQVSGMGPIAETELMSILDGEGLSCIATHEPPNEILSAPDKIVERLEKLNCKYTAYPFPNGVDLKDPKAVKNMILGLDLAGEVLRESGKILTYHNHGLEMAKLDGKVILDMVYEGTDPKNLQAEIDTCWVVAGGGDLLSWCQKLTNRLPLIHLKDYGGKAEGGRPIFEEIGQGQIQWAPVIEAAEKNGCEWFIVEQDGDWENNDPFESLKISFDYLRDNLCS